MVRLFNCYIVITIEQSVQEKLIFNYQNMNFFIRNIVWFVFTFLIAANVLVFISGVGLSDEINKFDKEVVRLHQENLELEKRLYEVESLNYASSMAAQLNFTAKADIVYLDNLKYAFKP